MSLDDKFEPNKYDWIDLVDEKLVDLHSKIVKLWQDKTYQSASKLEQYLHYAAAGNFFAHSGMNFIMGNTLYSAAAAMLGFWSALRGVCIPLRAAGAKYQQQDYTRSVKLVNYIAYCMGTFMLFMGLSTFAYNLFEPSSGAANAGFYGTSVGLGFVCDKAAFYISRADIGDPPKKRKRKPVLEKMRQLLLKLMPPPHPRPAENASYSITN